MEKIVRKLSDKYLNGTSDADLLDMVSRRWETYRTATIEQAKNPDILMAAIENQQKDEIRNAPKRDEEYSLSHLVLGDEIDKEFVCSPLKWADKSLQSNKDIVLAAVNKNWRALQYIPKKLCDDKDIMLAAIESQEPNAYYPEYGKNLFGKELLYVSTFTESPLAYATELKKDKDIVLTAIKKNCFAFAYASPQLQNDPEVLAAAINNQEKRQEFLSPKKSNKLRGVVDDNIMDELNVEVYNHIYSPLAWTPKFSNDSKLVLAAVRKNGLALEYASKELQNNPDIVLAAVRENGTALKFASKEIRDNRRYVLEGLKTTKDAFEVASSRIKKHDEELIEIYKYLTEDNYSLEKLTYNINFKNDFVYNTIKSIIINSGIKKCNAILNRKNVNSIEELPNEYKKDIEKIEEKTNRELIVLESQRKKILDESFENEKQ